MTVGQATEGSGQASLEDLPFPVAYPLHWARNPSGTLSPFECIQSALFATYQGFRLATHVLLAAYLWRKGMEQTRDLPRDEAIDRSFADLSRPYWSTWDAIAARLVIYWNRAGEACPVPQLRDALNRIRTKPHKDDPLWAHIQGRPGLGPKRQADSLFKAIWALRNALAHRSGTQSDATRLEDEATLAWLRAAATALATTLFETDPRLMLVHSVTGDGIVRLMGTHPDRTFMVEDCPSDWDGVLSESAMAAICGDVAIPLRPLGEALGEGTLARGTTVLEPAALLEAISPRHMVLMGVEHCEVVTPNTATPGLFQKTLDWLAQRTVRLEIPLEESSFDTIADVARYETLSRLRALTGRKYFPAFYVARSGIDDALERFKDSPKRALVLRGAAGSGKSSLLIRFAQSLIDAEAKGFGATERAVADSQSPIVIFLSGGQDFSDSAAAEPDLLLMRPIARALGIAMPKNGALPSLASALRGIAGRTAGATGSLRPIWLLLDGINESPRFTELVEAIDRFLPHLEQDLPAARLIISLRDEAYAAALSRLQRSGSIFINGHSLAEFVEEDGKPEPYLMVRPFKPEPEGREAFELCRKALPGAAFSYDALPEESLAPDGRSVEKETSLRQLLLNPLHLYLFHQAFQGVDVPPRRLNQRRLMSAYLDALIDGVRDTKGERLSSTLLDKALLDELASYMLAHRTALLPDDVMFHLDEAWLRKGRLRSMTMATSLSPTERLVDLSVLIRPSLDRRDYAFVHQALAEALLLRHLGAPLSIARIIELAPLTERADGGAFPELADALGEAAALLVRGNQRAGLTDLLTIEAEPAYQAIIRRIVLEILESPQAGDIMGAVQERLEAEPPLAPRFAIQLLSILLDLLGRAETGGLARLADLAERGFAQAITAAPHLRSLKQGAVSALVLGADLQKDLGDSELAKKKTLSAIAIIRGLIEAEGELPEFQRDLSISLERLGDLARNAGNTIEAKRFFEQGLAIAEKLARTDPANIALQRDLSVSSNKLGDLAREAGDTIEARRFFEQGLAIAETLARTDPGNINLQRDLFVSFDRLGDLARNAGDKIEARRFFEQGLAIAEKLARTDPANITLQRDLSVSFNKLGNLAREAGDTVEARRFFEQDLAIAEALVRIDPANITLQRDLTVSFSKLGDLAREAGDTIEAKRFFEQGLAIAEKLARTDPANITLQRDLSASFDRLGDLAREAGDTIEAKRFFEQGLAIAEKLARTDPANITLQRDLSVSFNKLGNLARDAGDTVEARRFFEQDLAIAEALVRIDPANITLQRDLTVSFSKLGDLARDAGDTIEAKRFFEQGLAITEALVRTDPANITVQRDLSVSFIKLGELARDAGDTIEARRFFEQGLAIREKLARTDPANITLQRDLFVSLERLGDLAQRSGDTIEARRFFEQGLAIAEQLARTDPANITLQRDLIVSFSKLAMLAHQEGNGEEEARRRHSAENHADSFLAGRIGSLDHYRQRLEEIAASLPPDVPQPILPGIWESLPTSVIFDLLLRQGRAAAFQMREIWLESLRPASGRKHGLRERHDLTIYELLEGPEPEDTWRIVTVAEGAFGIVHLDGDMRVVSSILRAAPCKLGSDAEALECALLLFRSAVIDEDGSVLWPLAGPSDIPWMPDAGAQDRRNLLALLSAPEIARTEEGFTVSLPALFRQELMNVTARLTPEGMLAAEPAFRPITRSGLPVRSVVYRDGRRLEV